MWSEAAKEFANFTEAVLTALDPAGYPVSVRQMAPRYDAATGEFSVVWPPELPVAEGPATVLCHYHDKNLWKIRQIQIKGRLERRADQWVFTSTDFRRPPRSQLTLFWRMSRDMRRAGRRYLDRRGLEMPAVNFEALRALRRRV
ncbi:MAG: hypothetical protein WAO15_14610 [Mycobacterium sp.]